VNWSLPGPLSVPLPIPGGGPRVALFGRRTPSVALLHRPHPPLAILDRSHQSPPSPEPLSAWSDARRRRV